MGRWGDKIYESDAALDYFVIFTERIEREIVYLFAPEQIRHNTAWLTKVLGVVEIVLLFDQHDMGSLSFLSYQSTAAKRWEELFFNVWDAQWNDEKD